MKRHTKGERANDRKGPKIGRIHDGARFKGWDMDGAWAAYPPRPASPPSSRPPHTNDGASAVCNHHTTQVCRTRYIVLYCVPDSQIPVHSMKFPLLRKGTNDVLSISKLTRLSAETTGRERMYSNSDFLMSEPPPPHQAVFPCIL